jgi:hypothetical protein
MSARTHLDACHRDPRIYNSEVDSGALHRLPSQAASGRPAMLRVPFMPISAFGPCTRQCLSEEYASACTFSSSLLQSENALRLMTILPPRKTGARSTYRSLSLPFPFPLHVLTHVRNTILSTDPVSYPQMPSAMIDASSSSSSFCFLLFDQNAVEDWRAV